MRSSPSNRSKTTPATTGTLFRWNENTINAISGATTGAVVSLVMNPLDVIKTRMQIQRKEAAKGFLATASDLYKNESMAAFFKSASTTFYGYVPNWCIYFSVYNYSKNKYHEWFPQHNTSDNIMSAITAGAVSNLITSPIWTIRTRMITQHGHKDYKNVFDAFRKISSKEGFGALYAGLVPSLFGLIHVAIQFPLYEALKYQPTHADDKPSFWNLLYASSASKLVASVIAYPHEVIRSRLQDASHASTLNNTSKEQFKVYKNVRDAIHTTWKEEGVQGFYRGLVPNLFRTVPGACITLLSFEGIHYYLQHHVGKLE